MLQEDYVKQLITLKMRTYIGTSHGNETNDRGDMHQSIVINTIKMKP